MRQRKEKSVLFLCIGNYYRSRFAEILFNSVAGRMGLPWKAFSRASPWNEVSTTSARWRWLPSKPWKLVGFVPVVDFARFPMQVTADDLDIADWIVALKQAEHLPLVLERFPARAEKVEFWRVDDALPLIEREIMSLGARIQATNHRACQASSHRKGRERDEKVDVAKG
jgi:low molecular weight protein-tyrosine phosphatase